MTAASSRPHHVNQGHLLCGFKVILCRLKLQQTLLTLFFEIICVSNQIEGLAEMSFVSEELQKLRPHKIIVKTQCVPKKVTDF